MRASLIFFVLLAIGAPYARAQTDELRFLIEGFGSADRAIRDIDVRSVAVSKPMVRLEPFTLGVQAGVLQARGSSIEPDDIAFSPADANGAYAGGYLRIGPTDEMRVMPFAEGGIALMLMDRPFPNNPSLKDGEGRVYGKFDIRWGVDINLNDRVAIEAAFALSHISNGSGFGPQNINYDGVGFALGVIRRW